MFGFFLPALRCPIDAVTREYMVPMAPADHAYESTGSWELVITGYIARGTAYCPSLAYVLCVMRYLAILLLPYLSSSKNPCVMTYMQYYLMRYEIVNCRCSEE